MVVFLFLFPACVYFQRCGEAICREFKVGFSLSGMRDLDLFFGFARRSFVVVLGKALVTNEVIYHGIIQ